MGKILPHSSFTARRGESKASISTRLRVLSEEWLPMTKLEGFGTGDIEVTLEPGVYLLLASFVLTPGTSGEVVRGRFYDVTNAAALLGGYQVPSVGAFELRQFSKIVEITSQTTLQFQLALDEELAAAGELYGGVYGEVQTGIQWARL